jgi:phosphatidylglycerophosphatase A
VGAQSWYWVLAGLILLYGLSYWRIKACVKDKDPSWIVIDEVLGMGVGCLFFTFDHWEKLLAFFVLFRLFDIIKIFPANIIDEQDSAHGILLDDIVSGLHASIVLASLWAFL